MYGVRDPEAEEAPLDGDPDPAEAALDLQAPLGAGFPLDADPPLPLPGFPLPPRRLGSILKTFHLEIIKSLIESLIIFESGEKQRKGIIFFSEQRKIKKELLIRPGIDEKGGDVKIGN